MTQKPKRRSFDVIPGRDDVMVQLNIKIPESLMNQLDYASGKTNTSKRDLATEGIREYMQSLLPRYGAVPENFPRSWGKE